MVSATFVLSGSFQWFGYYYYQSNRVVTLYVFLYSWFHRTDWHLFAHTGFPNSGPSAHTLAVLTGITGIALLVIFSSHAAERSRVDCLPKPPASIAELAPLVSYKKAGLHKTGQGWIPDGPRTEAELEASLKDWTFSLEHGKIVGERGIVDESRIGLLSHSQETLFLRDISTTPSDIPTPMTGSRQISPIHEPLILTDVPMSPLEVPNFTEESVWLIFANFLGYFYRGLARITYELESVYGPCSLFKARYAHKALRLVEFRVDVIWACALYNDYLIKYIYLTTNSILNSKHIHQDIFDPGLSKLNDCWRMCGNTSCRWAVSNKVCCLKNEVRLAAVPPERYCECISRDIWQLGNKTSIVRFSLLICCTHIACPRDVGTPERHQLAGPCSTTILLMKMATTIHLTTYNTCNMCLLYQVLKQCWLII